MAPGITATVIPCYRTHLDPMNKSICVCVERVQMHGNCFLHLGYRMRCYETYNQIKATL